MISVGWDDFASQHALLGAEDEQHEGWIYVLCESDGTALYVGQTRVRLRRRIAAHRRGQSPVLKRCKALGRYVDRIDAFKVAIHELDDVEGEAIRTLRPPANRAGL